MKLTKCINWMLACAAAATLAACASAPADNTAAAPSADGTQLASAAKPAKCKPSDAPTGSSIVRKDCSANPDVTSVDGREFMDSKRIALPDPLKTGR
jgi:hypothetical protein